MELAELISNLAVNPLLAMSSSMEVEVVSVEASVSEASSSLSPVYEELLEVVTLATVNSALIGWWENRKWLVVY